MPQIKVFYCNTHVIGNNFKIKISFAFREHFLGVHFLVGNNKLKEVQRINENKLKHEI